MDHMKIQYFHSILAAAVVLPFGFANAQGEKGKGKGRMGGFQPPKFSEIDTDKSGDVSKEEWIAHQVKSAKERAERSFTFLAGDDEKITEDELKGAMSRRGGGGPKGSSPKGGMGKGKGGDAKGGGEGKPKRPEIEE